MEQTKEISRRSGSFTLLIAAIPVFYVLSLGPAVRWHPACPSSMQKVIEAAYAPLVWLRDNTPLREPLDRYVDMWER
ncbi:MAG: hypothetical protein ACYTE3_05215 [Planctomycetota bacterium]|jgi:hypothetical protein